MKNSIHFEESRNSKKNDDRDHHRSYRKDSKSRERRRSRSGRGDANLKQENPEGKSVKGHRKDNYIDNSNLEIEET